MFDEHAQHFGLPNSLLVPIAARSTSAIEKYVGKITKQVVGRKGHVNAIAVIPHRWPPKKESSTPLWSHQNAKDYEDRLHPKRQVWVHVDYTNYRQAYIRFGMPEIPPNYVLDHVQNREAIRLREYSHPYLRLCPVSRRVNTSGGTNTGGEGMEKAFLRSLKENPDSVKNSFRDLMKTAIVYADPMDLTKMLDISPGTQVLDGVRGLLKLFYSEK
jgi:hypothetical protein